MTKNLIARYFSLAFVLVPVSPLAAQDHFADVIVDPGVLKLCGPNAVYSLLVTGKMRDPRLVDLTHDAKYQSSQPSIAKVSAQGVVQAITDGKAEIIVEAGGMTAKVQVDVQGTQEPRIYHFENDVVPLLSRFGCNSAGCHGNSGGQNGFKLSVFGFDPDADYNALVKEARGRRIVPSAPEASLFLAKPSGRLPHGGGIRIREGSAEYELMRGWIAAGTPMGDPLASKVVAVRVEPKERVMRMKGQQQIRVIARHADGREIDVTGHARYQANQEALASVSAVGLVSVNDTPGEVAIMASYMNCVDIFRAI